MQSQLCRICGERHHRYEPHRFRDPKAEDEPFRPSKVADMIHTTSEPIPTEPARSLPRRIHREQQAAPEAPRSSVRSQTHRTPRTDSTPPIAHSPEPTPAAAPDTPDTAPSPSPLSLTALDDTALRDLRNLVMGEDMRRRRARKRAARKEQT